MPAERLQKLMAAAGIASRRKAEELITAGLVSVNGQTVTELGTKADPEVDNIKVNGQRLGDAERHVYLLLNKPKGHVATVSDPEGRPTVLDLVQGVKARLYPVGPTRLPERGALAAHERWRAHAEAYACVVACAQDIPGEGERQAG